MITHPALLGCRVIDIEDDRSNDVVMGLIIGSHSNNQGSFFMILEPNGEFTANSIVYSKIHRDDLKRIKKKIKANNIKIEDRFEILDL
jgi:hypothetical protein